MPEALDPVLYRDLVRRALAEDLGTGDVTTAAIVPADTRADGRLVTRAACVVAGLDIALEAFAQVDERITIDRRRGDGDRCGAGEVLAIVHGAAASILQAERTALNVVQHLSGIATATRRFVDATDGRLTILDTRKTVPTWRALAKYAVRCGGGANHRAGLYDAILIKDNHIRIAGGVSAAVARARASAPGQPIEIEIDRLEDLEAAIAGRVDTVMLDNMDDARVAEAIRCIAGRSRVEVSGGVGLARLPVLAALGVDCVSVGELTHSAPAVDISLEIDPAASA